MRASSVSAVIELRAGPGRFAAEIEDVGALGLQFQGAVQRGVGIEVGAGVGKRVGRDVEDAHEERAPGPLQRARLDFPGVRAHGENLPPPRALG